MSLVWLQTSNISHVILFINDFSQHEIVSLVSVLRDNPKICLKGDRDFLPTEKKNFKS
jgi:hypothetical protein